MFVSFSPVDTTNYNFTSAQAYLSVRATNPAISYTAKELSGLGGTSTEPLAFNNLGQVAGYSHLPQNTAYHAFLFSNGVTTDLGTLGGNYSLAADLNDAGMVTGWAYTAFNQNQRAFLFNGTTMVNIGDLIPNSFYSEGRAINATGDVAVRAYGNTGYHAYLYSNGVMTDLGALPGGYNESYPTDINASRQVVGWSYPNTNCYHAFLATTAAMQDLGTLGGPCSQATAINDAGHVIGWSDDLSNKRRAFVYKNGQMTDLGTLGGDSATATAINNSGAITGWSYLAGNNQIHAFRYENGVMTDLGALNGQSRGQDINDIGEIIGWTQTVNFEQAGFVRKGSTLYDLNALINVGESAAVNETRFNNESGQIIGRNFANTTRWFVLTPTTLAPSSLTLTAAPGIYRGTTTLTATLSIQNPSGANVQFRLNGVVVGTAQADAQGVAQLTNVSLGTLNAGTHTAGASALFAGDATYLGSTAAADLTIAKAIPVITWANPAAITYPAALTSTQLNATTTVGGQFAFSPGSGTVLPAGTGHVLQATFTPTDTTNYETATKSVTIDILRRTPVVSWNNPANITYGTLLGATQLNATASVPGTFLYTPAAETKLDVGNNQLLSVAFTPNDTDNYNAVPVTTVRINVVKATPTVSWSNPAAIVYGTLLSDTQLNATSSVPGSFTYSPAAGTKLNAGSNQVLSVSFTPTDSVNYNSVQVTSVSINVSKATPTVDWSAPADIVYGALLSATQLNATASTVGTFVYSPAAGAKLNAGSGQTLSVAFTPADTTNYNAVPSTTVPINVLKGTPTVTWPTPADIVYGTLLSATQLNATASTDGTFTYTPAAGATLNAGNAQTLTVAFAPADTGNYNPVPTTTVSINVLKATPTVSWSTPGSIAYGTLLSAQQLNATASVPGTFVYSPAAGTKLNAGAGQTLSAVFTPDDAANYNSVQNTTVSIEVTKATPTITWANPADIVYGTLLGGAQLNATSSAEGTFNYAPAAGTKLNAGNNQTLSVTFTPTDTTNYTSANGNAAINVTRATAVLSLDGLSHTYNGNAKAAAVTSDPAGLSGVTLTYNGSATEPVAVGSYAVEASLTNPNYEAAPALGTLVIGKGTAALSLQNLSQTFNNSPRAASATSNPSGLTGIAITYDGSPTAPTNAGSYAVRAALTNANYDAPDAVGTLVIAKATASLTIGSLAHTYDGAAKAASVTTTPGGLGGAALTYNGSATAPIDAGSYAVHATLTHQNYEAPAADATLTIAKANQTISFGSLASHVYGDAPFTVSASASSALAVGFSATGACTVAGATVTITGGGACTITASQPGNGNYNAASNVTQQFNSTYSWSDVLQPINGDGSSVFKLGSTVPVKFQLTGASSAVTDLAARIYVAKMSNGVVGTELEATATQGADAGNLFRYDASGGQYIFNLGTKGMSQGTWQVRIDLLDGSTHVVLISLRK